MPVPRLVIAGAGSGAGKTTVAVGLMAALARRGLGVAAFKAGPDYIDPGWHRLATGHPSRNLDPWLLPEATVRGLFLRAATGADVALIEGVMGLFDGRGAADDSGGTAHLARLLQAPVLLVVDAGGMGRSAAAVVRGFRDFDPRVRVAGVVLNRVGSEGHARLVREAVEGASGLPVVGCLGRDEGIALPERHLGLVPPGEAGGDGGAAGAVDRLARRVARDVDLDAVLALAASAPDLEAPAAGPAWEGVPPPERAGGGGSRVRLGLALDEAFHFYYRDALDLLEDSGAELVPWSPLREPRLPQGLDGLFLGGGFPEVFAERLAANRGLLREIRGAAADGMPVYAECGGLLLLCRSLVDADGREHALAGVIPARAVMNGRLAGFGYKEAEALGDTLLLAAGERVRGHEFHYASLEWDAPDPASRPHAYRLRRHPDDAGRPEGWADGNVLASFLHLHFCARPDLARRLVDRCAAYREAGGAAARRAPRRARPRHDPRRR